MPHPQGASRLIELAYDFTTESKFGNRMHGTEEQRVMADQQINVVDDGLIDHRHGRIGRKCDIGDFMSKIAHNKTGFVPFLRIA